MPALNPWQKLFHISPYPKLQVNPFGTLISAEKTIKKTLIARLEKIFLTCIVRDKKILVACLIELM